MNMKRWMVWAAFLAAALTIPPTRAQAPGKETPPPLTTGVVKGDNVNLRGKPALGGEVVAQLQNGERVKILEEIKLKDAKQGEPEKWFRIALPQSVPVWVRSSYLDPATKTVKASRLNLRSGPGENYSVLGRAAQGTAVKELETRGEWVRIEPPADASAYVAAFLVTTEPTTPPATPPTTPPATPPTTPPPAVATTPPAAQPPPAPPPITDQKEVTLTAAPPPAEEITAPPPTPEPATTQPPKPPTPPAESTLAETNEPAMAETPPAEEIKEPEAPPKRIVLREGIVRRSVSIQAPTVYALEAVQRHRTINYLHSPPSNNIVLKDFYGARVVVTGEEIVDERWPNTPVIRVETLKTVP